MRAARAGAPCQERERRAPESEPFMGNHPHADGGVDRDGNDEEAVEGEPKCAALGAAKDFGGAQTALDGINHHREVAQNQGRHDKRAQPLQHVKTQIKHCAFL